jgi:hypothetical protein
LGASTEWPGVVPPDVEIDNLDEMAGKYPAVASELRAIAGGAARASTGKGHFTSRDIVCRGERADARMCILGKEHRVSGWIFSDEQP